MTHKKSPHQFPLQNLNRYPPVQTDFLYSLLLAFRSMLLVVPDFVVNYVVLYLILSLGCDFVEARDFGACFWFCSGSRVQTHFVETHFWVSESGIFGCLDLWNFVNALGFGFWNFAFFWMGEFGNFGFWNLRFCFFFFVSICFAVSCFHDLFFFV